jgi:hypothetical protein
VSGFDLLKSWEELTIKHSAMLNTFSPELNSLYEWMIRLICSSNNVHLCKQILVFVTSIYCSITWMNWHLLLSFWMTLLMILNCEQRSSGFAVCFWLFKMTLFILCISQQRTFAQKASDEIFSSKMKRCTMQSSQDHLRLCLWHCDATYTA